jgi:hypothetical protein
MDDIFQSPGAGVITAELWRCARCGFEKPKYVVKPPKPSPIVLLSSPSSTPEVPKSVAPDESVHYDPAKARKQRS